MKASVLIAASLAQIGEFSFILAALGVQLGMLPAEGRDLILAGAIVSILLNPLVFVISDRWRSDRAKAAVAAATAPPAITPKKGRAVLVGYGRVGSVIGEALQAADADFTVVEDQQEIVDALMAKGVSVIAGNAVSGPVMAEARLADADWLFVTAPDSFEAGRMIEMARAANPKLNILARAHSDAEAEHLKALGADLIVMGEREIARAMIAASAPLIPIPVKT
jgi:CPA2 family monovalent cation:H+ antiporter-2